jgi:primosomal replication protein N
VSPEALCQLITERLERIPLLQDSPSEIEVEMCVLGYRSCAEDTVSLVRMVEVELPGCGPIRRLRLKMARRMVKVRLRRVHGILSRRTFLLPSHTKS